MKARLIVLSLGSVALATAFLALFWSAGDAITARARETGVDVQTKEIREELRNPADPASLLVGEPAIMPHTLSVTLQEGEEAEVGDQAVWAALQGVSGFFYGKVFELRAANEAGEVWIAIGEGVDPAGDDDGTFGLDFLSGDCRNDGVRNVVTDDQAEYLLEQFTTNIEAVDQAWFGEPLFRDGTTGPLPRPSPAGKQVVLVDNVRDENFYDTDNANTLPYIAGFFTSAMDFFHGRNVMSIDGYDWLHRTGPDPAHEPSGDPCTSAPARPYLYEGVFAHEYQHLIHQDYDPDEFTWVNEGMADLAILLTGYGDPSLHIDEKGNDSHIMSFQGWESVMHPDWNPIPRPNGPENSLTAWEDQGFEKVLADYGFAYIFMVYLLDHGYGQDFFLAWHHNSLNGIEGLNDSLATFGSEDTFDSLFDDINTMILVDAYLDGGATLTMADGGDLCLSDCASQREALTSDSLDSTIFFSEHAYGTTGAPPWGSDYLPLRRVNNFRPVTFDGDDVFTFPSGNDWTIDGDGYWTTPDDQGGTVYPNNADSSIARLVSVPAGAPTLTFEHWYQIELGWDFAFVQVLTGDDFVSLPCTGTTTDHNPDADPTIAAEVPGYTGPSDDPTDPSTAGTAEAPLAASCDLSAFAGQDIILSFRLMTDPAAQLDGWHIRNVGIDGTPVDSTPDDLSDWDNQGFFLPVDLSFKLTLVGLSGDVDGFGHVTDADDVTVIRTNLGPGSTYSLNLLHRLLLWESEQVIAIISGVPDGDETDDLYFPYSLKLGGQQWADGAGIHARGRP